jgi:hypothetical protein
MSVRALDTNSPAPFAPTPAVTPSRRQCAKKQSTKQWDMGPEVAVFARWVTPPSTTPTLDLSGDFEITPTLWRYRQPVTIPPAARTGLKQARRPLKTVKLQNSAARPNVCPARQLRCSPLCQSRSRSGAARTPTAFKAWAMATPTDRARGWPAYTRPEHSTQIVQKIPRSEFPRAPAARRAAPSCAHSPHLRRSAGNSMNHMVIY